MKQSILFGNGVNRLTDGEFSWENLITRISKGREIKNIPNTLKYEAILLQQDKTSNWEANNLFLESEDTKSETALKNEIGKEMEAFGSNEIYGKIAKMPFDHFMTTNYDKALLNEFGENSYELNEMSEKLYSIRRNITIKTSEESETKYYWPIHGYCERPRSIMLGYDQYCGSLAKIDSYVKGNYKYKDEPWPSIKKRLEENDFKKVISWIDLFFISDVHVIGLGLGYEEIDLWWILNRRKRIMSDMPEKVKNEIYFYETSEIEKEKIELFKSFGVEFIPLKNRALLKDKKSFPARYNSQLEEMIIRMNKRKNV